MTEVEYALHMHKIVKEAVKSTALIQTQNILNVFWEIFHNSMYNVGMYIVHPYSRFKSVKLKP